MRALLLTLVVAVGTAVLQIVMKGISFPNPPGKTHALEREDALFWSDWTLAGTIALAGSIFAASIRHESISPAKLGTALAAIFLGCTVFPFFLRVFVYQAPQPPPPGAPSPSPKIKVAGWKGALWIIVPNVVGILILFSAVAAGVKVYDWE